jgi:beta-lactamase class A
MEAIERRLRDILAPLGGGVGVAARDLGTGVEVTLNANEPYPLASVFKIPVMVVVLQQVDAGSVRLDERLELREQDKCPGGILMFCHAGLRLTVRDLLYLMIAQSDNIATDMLWRRAGLDSVNRAMRALSLTSIDCHSPNREYFLVETGAREPWSTLTAAEVVERLRAARSAGELRRLYDDVLAAAADLDGETFQRLYDERFGQSGDLSFEHGFEIDQALDNTGTPRDVLDLLALIAGGRCASPSSCRLMIEILSRQEWRDRIPAGLPTGLLVANKTGSVNGTVNDAALAFRRDGSAVAIVILSKGPARGAAQHPPPAGGAAAAALWSALG